MGYEIFWVAMLLASLLWVAAWAALVGRIKRKWMRLAILVVVLDPPIGLMLQFVAASAAAKFAGHIEVNYFEYFLSLFLAFLIGMIAILIRSKRKTPQTLPAASTWPWPQ